MGYFSKRESDDHDMQEDIDRGKQMGAELRRVREAHETHDFLRPEPERARGRNLSGPTSSDASTPRGRRRW
ncbi:hypothetical protein [Streptomyces sp. NPDC056361]|uniref:hypothetical protein n=1 Tax=Streptomyces sp. NPDC056361 TaxID=3345795 RepID=UPI0035DBB817